MSDQIPDWVEAILWAVVLSVGIYRGLGWLTVRSRNRRIERDG